MLVTTYRDGRARTGLMVGEANARRYFRKRSSLIELRLDDLHIQCTLEPDFWQGHPEIHDPRLSVWLEFKAGRGLTGRQPMQMSMVPSGANTYVVRPEARRAEALAAEITMLPSPDTDIFDIPELETRSVA
jgi:hypothetical protein